MSNATATAKRQRQQKDGLATLGELAEIKPVTLEGVHQIKRHNLKEGLYFKFPVVVAVKSHHLDLAIESLEHMNLHAAWWYSGRNKVHFAPLYPETTDVSAFGSKDKNEFQHQLGLIASCLDTNLRGVDGRVELLPSIPKVFSETQEGFLITQQVGLEVGHSLNYRKLSLSHDGLKMTASYQWQNRRRGDSSKGEAMFVEGDQSRSVLIDLKCLKNDEIVDEIVTVMFGNDSKPFQDAMAQKLGDIIYDLSGRARASRRKIEDEAANQKQLHTIQSANLGW